MESPAPSSPLITRRGLLRAGVRGFIGLGALTSGSIAWARFYEPEWLQTTFHDVRLPYLPSAFDGFRMAQISDLHIDGDPDDANLVEVARYVSSLKVDAIVITGDFISHWNNTIETNLKRGLSELKAREGVFGVLGNHDYWADEPHLVRGALRETNVTELTNDFHLFERASQRLYLCGLDDLWSGTPDIAGLAARVPPNSAAMVLGHEPDFADEISATGKFGLMLSGHSHGGQVAMPFFGPIHLPPHARKYPCGRYEVNGMTLYTNRGLGTVGLRLRFCARPEVSVFTLRV